jgi:beta-lactamase class A
MVNKNSLFSVCGLVILLTGSMVLFNNSDYLNVFKTMSTGSGYFFERHLNLDNGETEKLREQLESEIQKSKAEVSLAFKDQESGEKLLIHSHEMMHAASLMKVPVMIELFWQAERGKFSLKDKIPIRNQFKSIVDGSIYTLRINDDSDDEIYKFIGTEQPIRDLLTHMITMSSNLATNILIEFVEVKNVMKRMEELGIQNIEMLRGVEDIKAFEKGLNNRTDAFSIMQVMMSIAEGKAGSSEACREMIEILKQQKFRSKIPAGIPEDVKVANKTGSITRIDHDAAIVFPKGRKPYVLVIMTRGIEEHEKAEKLIAKLSRIVYESLTEHKTKEEEEKQTQILDNISIKY